MKKSLTIPTTKITKEQREWLDDQSSKTMTPISAILRSLIQKEINKSKRGQQ